MEIAMPNGQQIAMTTTKIQDPTKCQAYDSQPTHTVTKCQTYSYCHKMPNLQLSQNAKPTATATAKPQQRRRTTATADHDTADHDTMTATADHDTTNDHTTSNDIKETKPNQQQRPS